MKELIENYKELKKINTKIKLNENKTQTVIDNILGITFIIFSAISILALFVCILFSLISIVTGDFKEIAFIKEPILSLILIANVSFFVYKIKEKEKKENKKDYIVHMISEFLIPRSRKEIIKILKKMNINERKLMNKIIKTDSFEKLRKLTIEDSKGEREKLEKEIKNYIKENEVNTETEENISLLIKDFKLNSDSINYESLNKKVNKKESIILKTNKSNIISL
tara:strand:+ start:48178 stop:48849 length:672 start_codon:yes stop_codon:yes gene_type:complete